MSELTLEALAARVAAIEKQLSERTPTPPKDAWRAVIGLSEDNEFTRSMIAEMEAASNAEREAAQSEPEQQP